MTGWHHGLAEGSTLGNATGPGTPKDPSQDVSSPGPGAGTDRYGPCNELRLLSLWRLGGPGPQQRLLSGKLALFLDLESKILVLEDEPDAF
mmetsp:Transcript_54321/g.86405  ORF Transcript_54321/g.86405 Transcript_54321/m.86405 type:complete len:91 (+) Transcript_54321:181-453(+)